MYLIKLMIEARSISLHHQSQKKTDLSECRIQINDVRVNGFRYFFRIVWFRGFAVPGPALKQPSEGKASKIKCM